MARGDIQWLSGGDFADEESAGGLPFEPAGNPADNQPVPGGSGPEEPISPPSNPEGSTDKPRDIFNNQPVAGVPDVRPREPGAGPSGGSTPSPAGQSPASPTPSSAQPFEPLNSLMDPTSLARPRDPGSYDVALRAPGITSPTTAAPSRPSMPTPAVSLRAAPFVSQPQQFAESGGGGGMFGRSGGLESGGLGLTGSGNSFENSGNPIDALIRLLLEQQ